MDSSSIAMIAQHGKQLLAHLLQAHGEREAKLLIDEPCHRLQSSWRALGWLGVAVGDGAGVAGLGRRADVMLRW